MQKPIFYSTVFGFRTTRTFGLILLANTIFAPAHAFEVTLTTEDSASYKPLRTQKPVDGQLPGSITAHGGQENDIKKAWLTGATDRYAHGILDDDIEASSLTVETRDGQTLIFVLDENRVFEDIRPRLVDIDKDGSDEIILVESDTNLGAALAVYGVRDNQLKPLTFSPFIGLAYRWLNPLGIGDFNGDGKNEIASVTTPHIGGILRIYSFTSPELTLISELRGVSTHTIGSTELALGRVVKTLEKDLILAPDQSRQRLLLLELDEDRIVNRGEVSLPDAISRDLISVGENVWVFQTLSGNTFRVSVSE